MNTTSEQTPTRTTRLTLDITTPDGLDDLQVCALIDKLIAIGVMDAISTIEDKEGDLSQAHLAANLEIGDAVPLSTTKPRVLVVVGRGGVAEDVSDDGADVHIFDWANYDADPVGTGPAPAHFADLADLAGVPCPSESDDSAEADRPKG